MSHRKGVGIAHSHPHMPVYHSLSAGKWNYRPLMVIRRGAFGMVYLSMGPSGQRVALKKVKYNHSINRELSILQMINSPCCSSLLDHFDSHEGDDHFLCLVTEMIPESFGAYIRRCTK
jgi:serine/threonine protein kinase